MSLSSSAVRALELDRHLSVIAPVQGELSRLVRCWQGAHGVAESVQTSHLTIFLYEPTPSTKDMVLSSLVKALYGQYSFSVSMGAIESFMPLSEVSYLPVLEGAADLMALRQRCIDAVGESSSPFTYVPHLSVSNRLGQRALTDSLQYFASLPSTAERFVVDHLQICEHVQGTWRCLRTVPLDTSHD
ncbi:2'-5' RNA ligase family protein [Rothia sp. P6271]|uniref:2'-5' RNA ligase family protein n=1 Tax=Rothia sp. P6271 TaxID=3402659 RepID=UPI003ACCCC36